MTGGDSGREKRAVIIRAPAKINLGLNILRRRPDGYHDLVSVMQQISLADTIRLEPRREGGWRFFCSEPALAGKENLVCRAAAILVEKAGPRAHLPGVAIYLFKNIPMAAGLGGGSSDAAAALKGLNSFWNLKMTAGELLDIGAQIGSDVPYCLQGGTALVGGRGERLEAMPALPFHWVVLAVPRGISFSTAEVYGALEPARLGRPPLELLIAAIQEQRKDLLRDWFAGGSTNTLESAVMSGCSPMRALKQHFMDLGLSPAMSGSGPAYFALSNSLPSAVAAACALEEAGHRSFLCWTISGL